MKKIIAIFIIFLFTPSTFGSMAVGFDSINSGDDELEVLLDDLRFVCTDI